MFKIDNNERKWPIRFSHSFINMSYCMYININVKSSHVIGYLHLYVMRIEPHLLMVSKKSCSIEKYYEWRPASILCIFMNTTCVKYCISASNYRNRKSRHFATRCSLLQRLGNYGRFKSSYCHWVWTIY